jgi:hypothetical protein
MMVMQSIQCLAILPLTAGLMVAAVARPSMAARPLLAGRIENDKFWRKKRLSSFTELHPQPKHSCCRRRYPE